MGTVILLKGLPCSGKTEYALKWCNGKIGRVRISRTDICRTLGLRSDIEKNVLAYDAAIRILRISLHYGYDVIIDECNLYGPDYSLFLSNAQQMGGKIKFVSIKTSPEDCKKRSAQLGHPISDDMIDRLWEKHKDWILKG